MTDVLDRAVEALRRMQRADRDSMAEAILTVAEGRLPLDIESEHLPYVLEGPAQLKRGDFIEGTSEEIVAGAFKRRA